MTETEKIIREFDWCDGEDQTIGAMASEIRHLRENIKNLQTRIEQLDTERYVKETYKKEQGYVENN